MDNYKRKDRSVNDETKQKISQSLTGRAKSAEHCAHISNGLKNYWSKIPKSTGGATIEDILM